ncbi:aldehyde dehydrogenase [Punctularia strigosozonata HHB-11173 SS5]|uniref:Aldehyde dehydrogenase n=1 Tax=Punctularia strigosozonata (strain HHB-11173) TaxID=741275 RepID=R7S017_PUNST|nr:aldehyde dehydrogenase [Punctularia strigosozonata HHB-11173 SS5]EIN03578.1 aldehyde dehydrogenase [Punctularia strigosozonata HHB-11173 SS5]
MVELKHTVVDELPKIAEELRATFRSGKTRPLAWRRHQLHQVARMMQENKDEFTKAIAYDMRKPALEVYAAEIGPITERALKSAEQLEEWAKPELVSVPDWQKSWQPTLTKMPKGVVLNIAPWNYPIILTLQPLIGAIAAGCCCVVKPSELAPAIAQLLADLVSRYLDPSAYRIVNGAVTETTKLLELKWDHIFYTGNGRIARIVAAAAAKHLTPVTLELGGKSPVIVDPSYDLELAAKRILFGKACNAGQICVAPDYVLIPRSQQDELVEAMKARIAECYPEGTLKSDSYGRIISDLHQKRLKSLLNATKGVVVTGGQTDDDRGFELTIVKDVGKGDSLMSEEIFGPILPIVPVDSMDEAIAFVNERPHALVLYAFTEDPQVKQQITDTTASGSLVFNDTFQQLSVNETPFSGVGESGYGGQVMKYTFDGFTHLRTTIDIPKEAEPTLEVRYAPYTAEKLSIMTGLFQSSIPSAA